MQFSHCHVPFVSYVLDFESEDGVTSRAFGVHVSRGRHPAFRTFDLKSLRFLVRIHLDQGGVSLSTSFAFARVHVCVLVCV